MCVSCYRPLKFWYWHKEGLSLFLYPETFRICKWFDCLHAIRILGFERSRSESCDLVRFSCEHGHELSRAEQPLVSEEGICCMELNHVTCLGFMRLSQRCWWLVFRDVMTWRLVDNYQFGRTCCLFVSWSSHKFFQKRRLTISSPVVYICTTRFNTKKFHVVPTQCICVFCVDLRANSD